MSVRHMTAAYDSKIEEKEKAQAIINGSKGTARPSTSPVKNFAVPKRQSSESANQLSAQLRIPTT